MNITMNSKKKRNPDGALPVNNNLKKKPKHATATEFEYDMSNPKKPKRKKNAVANENNIEIEPVKERKKRKTDDDDDAPLVKRVRRKPKTAIDYESINSAGDYIDSPASLGIDDGGRNGALLQTTLLPVKAKRKSKTLAQQALAQQSFYDNEDDSTASLSTDDGDRTDVYLKKTAVAKQTKRKSKTLAQRALAQQSLNENLDELDSIASLTMDDGNRNETYIQTAVLPKKTKRKSKTLAQQALAQQRLNDNTEEIKFPKKKPAAVPKKEGAVRKRVKKKDQTSKILITLEVNNVTELPGQQLESSGQTLVNKKEGVVGKRAKKKESSDPANIVEVSHTTPLNKEEQQVDCLDHIDPLDKKEVAAKKKLKKKEPKTESAETVIVEENNATVETSSKQCETSVNTMTIKEEILLQNSIKHDNIQLKEENSSTPSSTQEMCLQNTLDQTNDIKNKIENPSTTLKTEQTITVDITDEKNQTPALVKTEIPSDQSKEEDSIQNTITEEKPELKKPEEFCSMQENMEIVPLGLIKQSPDHIKPLPSQNNVVEEVLENNVIQIPEGPVSNRVHITLQGLDDTDSELNESEIFGGSKKKVDAGEKDTLEGKKKRQVITWPEEDLRTLVARMEYAIPENDSIAYNNRMEKLEWDSIAFKAYSVEDCRRTWLLIQKKIRKFRLLREVLNDAKVWISSPKVGPGRKRLLKGPIRHPDMPRKPLSAYFIYYLRKKDVLLSVNPGMDATEISKHLSLEYKSLPPEKRMKYENLAAKKKGEYEQKLAEFYLTHPDVPQFVRAPKKKKKGPPKIRPEKLPKPPKPPKPIKEKLPTKPKPPPKPKPVPRDRIPKRPLPPFQFYFLDALRRENPEDKLAFKEACKERWKMLADKDKVLWITHAETEYAKYEEELKRYVESHPEFAQNRHKSILTKEETQIKDRVAGKPVKPPTSAYNLYARYLLQAEEIKNIPVKDRLIYVSNQWKNCVEEEKKQYKDLSAKLNEKYKLDFASYLESLPEEERKLELKKHQRGLPKQPTKCSKKPTVVSARKKELAKKKKPEKKIAPVKKVAPVKKIVEPEQPPISAFKYFALSYTGEEPAQQAWKALGSEQKKMYEEELVKKKQAYIVDFERFLKSLTKEELEAFSNSRRKIKRESEEEDEEEDSSDESDSEDTEGSNDEAEVQNNVDK